jgi:hypothetical protein
MLSLLAVPQPSATPAPYAEAVARLASIRHALRLVEPHGGGPAPDNAGDEGFGLDWQDASESRRRRCDARSGRVIAGTAAGLEALLAEGQAGRTPNGAANRKLAEEIRAGLAEISAALSDAAPRPDPIAL